MTPFYEKARNLWQAVQNAQILKGLQKYPEPFNPHNWTSEELLNHALEEAVDLTHYLVGLKEQLDAKDDYIAQLEQELVFLRKKIQAFSSFRNQPTEKTAPTPKYFDADDQ